MTQESGKKSHSTTMCNLVKTISFWPCIVCKCCIHSLYALMPYWLARGDSPLPSSHIACVLPHKPSPQTDLIIQLSLPHLCKLSRERPSQNSPRRDSLRDLQRPKALPADFYTAAALLADDLSDAHQHGVESPQRKRILLLPVIHVGLGVSDLRIRRAGRSRSLGIQAFV